MDRYRLGAEDYYFDEINSINNERIVELKITFDYFDEIAATGDKNSILEIGNVLGFYGYGEHECIDKFAKEPDTGRVGIFHNVDAIDFDYSGRDVISVSTIEHIGLPDYENPTPNNGEDAIKALEKIEKEANSFFITFGPDQNKVLDNYVIENINRFNWYGWIRTGLNEWKYTEQDMKVWDTKKDDPFEFANGIILLRNKG